MVMGMLMLVTIGGGCPLQSASLCSGQVWTLLVFAPCQSNDWQKSVHLGFAKTSLYVILPNETISLVRSLSDCISIFCNVTVFGPIE